jgi:hypothetical protein
MQNAKSKPKSKCKMQNQNAKSKFKIKIQNARAFRPFACKVTGPRLANSGTNRRAAHGRGPDTWDSVATARHWAAAQRPVLNYSCRPDFVEFSPQSIFSRILRKISARFQSAAPGLISK